MAYMPGSNVQGGGGQYLQAQDGQYLESLNLQNITGLQSLQRQGGAQDQGSSAGDFVSQNWPLLLAAAIVIALLATEK